MCDTMLMLTDAPTLQHREFGTALLILLVFRVISLLCTYIMMRRVKRVATYKQYDTCCSFTPIDG